MPKDVKMMLEELDLLFNDWVEQCSIETMEDYSETIRRKKRALVFLLRRKRKLRAFIDETWESFEEIMGI